MRTRSATSRTFVHGRSLTVGATAAALATAVCCIGLPAAVSLVSAVGAGFVITDRYLQPALVVVLVVTIAASGLTYRRHRNPAPLVATVVSAAIVYWFIYRDYEVRIVWIGIVAMVAARVWDVLAVRSCASRSATIGSDT